jgi:hypothetical protein
MPGENSKWLRDLLVIPLVVGVVIAAFTYGLPKILEKGKEISYTIDGPTAYLSQSAIGNVAITVNGIPTSELFTYKVRVWNSGGVPITNIPIRLVFNADGSTFKIFNVAHATEPTYEFGGIQEQGSDTTSKRFVFGLLNPGNQDVITLVTNTGAPLQFYSNVEGVRIKQVGQQEPRNWVSYLAPLAAIIGFVGSLLSELVKSLINRKGKKP